MAIFNFMLMEEKKSAIVLKRRRKLGRPVNVTWVSLDPFMANEASLEGSLQRITSLGLEVLARASRRKVGWASVTVSDANTARDQDETDFNEAFASISEFMAETSHQCQRYYEADRCTEITDTERQHISRFHSPLGAVVTYQVLPPEKHNCCPCWENEEESEAGSDENISITVAPRSNATTTSAVEPLHTQVVILKPKDRVNVNFTVSS